MDLLSFAILALAMVTTLWLLIYVRILLPMRIQEKFSDSMAAFSRAVELRFPGHSGLTADIEEAAVRLGKELDLSKSSLQKLKTASRLMDIGLCAMPYKLINLKPSFQWTAAERATYERHPEISGAMLDLVPSLRDITEIVRAHHQPFRMPTLEQVPLEARILRVSSDYAWSVRQHGEARAAQMIMEGSGTEYCPDVVAALATVIRSSRVPESERCIA